MQRAAAQGQKIYQIDKNNRDQLANVRMSNEYMADDINEAISAGGYAIVPEKAVDGAGRSAIYVYYTENPQTGYSAWKISGGLNGGWMGFVSFLGAVWENPSILLPYCEEDFDSTRHKSFDQTMVALDNFLFNLFIGTLISIGITSELKKYGFVSLVQAMKSAHYFRSLVALGGGLIRHVLFHLGPALIPLALSFVLKGAIAFIAFTAGAVVGSAIAALLCREPKSD
ncbi:hypothetical protein [Ostreibacterium oceani]|uniref:Uncharacterized protein n=1 Tax=Ostreibacterium oceani TaxID=2654998 RepID=A0A6N7EYA3_9GAMM|nr:hypothetical protein [Ostreibacterium oceani]MPV86545.1 hypothetical protein [Ostreibacterium oceani]